MRILLTNDDGIHANGFAVLERIARSLSDDVWVCAPAEERSGAGHSLTLSQPVRVRRQADRRFAITGTPTDAVMFAVNRIMKDSPPDLILSGVNRGANLGDDVTYSGTVSAAMEGALAGFRAIALSQVFSPAGTESGLRFDAAEAWGAQAIRPIMDMDFASRTLVSINFPACAAADVAGIRICRQGFHDYSRTRIVEGRDPRGGAYYWFGLGDAEHTPGRETDLEVIADNHVSVTPLHIDLTHYPSLDQLAARYGA